MGEQDLGQLSQPLHCRLWARLFLGGGLSGHGVASLLPLSPEDFHHMQTLPSVSSRQSTDKMQDT